MRTPPGSRHQLTINLPTFFNSRGTDRVRVCLYAGSTVAELDSLIPRFVAVAVTREEDIGQYGELYYVPEDVRAVGNGEYTFLHSRRLHI